MASQQQRTGERDWKTTLKAVLFLFVVLCVGPLALVCGWLIQRWCAATRLDAQDRWNAITLFAWFFGILVVAVYTATFTFPVFLARTWSHTPLHVLGPPTIGNILFQWSLGLLFSPVLALLLERERPLTIRWYLRRATTEEKQTLARQAAEHQAQRDQQTQITEAARQKATRTVYKSFQPTVAAQPKQAATQEVTIPPPESDMLRYAKEQAATREQARNQFLQEQVAKGNKATPPAPQPSVPPGDQKKQKKEKIDLGDGSMDDLL